jgi:hypothetical protein
LSSDFRLTGTFPGVLGTVTCERLSGALIHKFLRRFFVRLALVAALLNLHVLHRFFEPAGNGFAICLLT